jgi:hypothetical protein
MCHILAGHLADIPINARFQPKKSGHKPEKSRNLAKSPQKYLQQVFRDP